MAKILIVDDDPVCCRLLKRWLSRFGPCDVAYNGHEAIGAFRIALEQGAPYDLVCLDILMPCAHGHRVLDVIRELERQNGIAGSEGVKVVMITAVADPKHCIRAFREGCESYITKPLDENHVIEQVTWLLGAPAEA